METLLKPVPFAETATEWLLPLSETDIVPLMPPETDRRMLLPVTRPETWPVAWKPGASRVKRLT